MAFFNSRNDPVELFGYTDSDWAGDTIESKTTSGYSFFIGSGFFFLEFEETAGDCIVYSGGEVYCSG